MTKEDLIAMAAEAGFDVNNESMESDASEFGRRIAVHEFAVGDMLEKFASLVSARTREECAKVCDGIYAEERQEPECYGFASECAAAIRAMGERT